MKRPLIVWVVGGLLLLVIVVAGTRRRAAQPSAPPPSAFMTNVDLKPLEEIAVHRDGRINSLQSYARSMMRFVSGPREINGQGAVFTYFDLMFRPRQYDDVDLVYVKNKPLRGRIGEALRQTLARDLEAIGASGDQSAEEVRAGLEKQLDDRLARFFKTGLLSPMLLESDGVQAVLEEASTDLIRSAKFVDMIETGLAVARPDVLRGNLRIVPPPNGGINDPWVTVDQFLAMSSGDDQAVADMQAAIRAGWDEMQTGWAEQDAQKVNNGIGALASQLPGINSEVYPSERRAGWPWAFAGDESPWPWGVSLGLIVLSLGLVLASFSSERASWRPFAFTLFGSLAFLYGTSLALGQTNPLALESWYFRSYNMTWVWMIYLLSVVFLLLAVVYRWNTARWIGLGVFTIAFGLQSFSVLLRWYVSDRWPNANMFEAVTTAAWFGGCFAILLEPAVRQTPMRGFFALGSAVASMVALMCAYYLPVALSADIQNMMPVLHDVWLYIHTNVIIFSYCLIFMAAVTAFVYLLYRMGGGDDDYAKVGGAGSLIMTTPDGGSVLQRTRTSFGQVLDGTTMVLMELSFVLLWAGLVMGAIWADHSWGRPWGWDPKEVFALNTFLVFAVLIHVRLKTKDKALWTALIALVGAGVMLFNWIFINFFIVGLHSYA